MGKEDFRFRDLEVSSNGKPTKIVASYFTFSACCEMLSAFDLKFDVPSKPTNKFDFYSGVLALRVVHFAFRLKHFAFCIPVN